LVLVFGRSFRNFERAGNPLGVAKSLEKAWELSSRLTPPNSSREICELAPDLRFPGNLVCTVGQRSKKEFSETHARSRRMRVGAWHIGAAGENRGKVRTD